LFVYLRWAIRWLIKFTLLKEEYGDEEKEYLTYKGLNLSQQYWIALDEFDREDLMRKQLWVPDNLKTYRKQQEDEMRVKMAESGRHKMWRRYMKKGGPGQMTFMED